MKHALVTGSGKRIGRSIALCLAQNGWDVTIHYRTAEKEAETLAEKIRKLGRKAFTVCADMEKPEEVERILAGSSAPATALVHNASLFERDERDPDGSRHSQVNYLAPLRLNRLFSKQLPSGLTGGIVHLLDGTPMPSFLSAYAKSRAALEAALPEEARRYAPFVRINALVLGPVLRGPREAEEHFNRLVEKSALGRATTPQEVGQAVLSLLSLNSVTGKILTIQETCLF